LAYNQFAELLYKGCIGCRLTPKSRPHHAARHSRGRPLPNLPIVTFQAGVDPEKIEEGFTGWDQGNI